jgi:hypothetical protein
MQQSDCQNYIKKVGYRTDGKLGVVGVACKVMGSYHGHAFFKRLVVLCIKYLSPCSSKKGSEQQRSSGSSHSFKCNLEQTLLWQRVIFSCTKDLILLVAHILPVCHLKAWLFE